GQYEGSIRVTDTSTGSQVHVPYWYAVRSDKPAAIAVLSISRPRQSQDAVRFRITDASGIPMSNLEPEVTVVSGAATVTSVNSRDSLFPGAYGVILNGGVRRGTTVLRIQAGDISREVSVPN